MPSDEQNGEFGVTQLVGTTASFDAIVDVGAQNGSFAYGFDLSLQNIEETIVAVAGGLHSTATVKIDTSVPSAQQVLAVYFDAPCPYGTDITFAISLALQPSQVCPGWSVGSPKTFSAKWTTSSEHPAHVKANIPLSAFKVAGTGTAGGGAAAKAPGKDGGAK